MQSHPPRPTPARPSLASPPAQQRAQQQGARPTAPPPTAPPRHHPAPVFWICDEVIANVVMVIANVTKTGFSPLSSPLTP